MMCLNGTAEQVALPRLGCGGGLFGIRTAVRERFVQRERRLVGATPVRNLAAFVADFLRARFPFARESHYSRSVTVTRGTVVVAPPVAVVPAEVAEARAGLVARIAVHRQLRVALQSDKLTSAQKKAVKRALDDPEIYSAAVKKVHSDLNKSLSRSGVTARAIGDGTLLKLLLDNLPAIIEAVLRIIDALT